MGLWGRERRTQRKESSHARDAREKLKKSDMQFRVEVTETSSRIQINRNRLVGVMRTSWGKAQAKAKHS